MNNHQAATARIHIAKMREMFAVYRDRQELDELCDQINALWDAEPTRLDRMIWLMRYSAGCQGIA